MPKTYVCLVNGMGQGVLLNTHYRKPSDCQCHEFASRQQASCESEVRLSAKIRHTASVNFAQSKAV
jgi:hypothetical protein